MSVLHGECIMASQASGAVSAAESPPVYLHALTAHGNSLPAQGLYQLHIHAVMHAQGTQHV